jgi:AcrR family transcriptional regulator
MKKPVTRVRAPRRTGPLTAEAWAEAALDAIGAGGLAAVQVQALAATLGATKGSFYWHFTAREDLIVAALALWERRATVDVIARLEREVAGPRERLATVFDAGFRGLLGARIDAALLADAADALVAPVLARVTARRLAFSGEQFAALGFTAAESRRQALLAYAAYIGHAQLRRAGVVEFPAAGEADRYLDHLTAVLLARKPSGR